ncbi:V-type proton ATPase subunit d2 [Medicago truncatula]|uniref:V-type proton ATPase subunit d2 n=2 Tax=Medicago truncatula TaxID=3880 RepID=A0A072TWM5_MEDTR|nr:V-type proton ATPase subunit d2 [Medicago truncatula]
MRELYRLVLVDTPLAPYFSECITSEHLMVSALCSIGTELTEDDRRKLYSNFGLFYPYGHEELAVCEDIDQL